MLPPIDCLRTALFIVKHLCTAWHSIKAVFVASQSDLLACCSSVGRHHRYSHSRSLSRDHSQDRPSRSLSRSRSLTPEARPAKRSRSSSRQDSKQRRATAEAPPTPKESIASRLGGKVVQPSGPAAATRSGSGKLADAAKRPAPAGGAGRLLGRAFQGLAGAASGRSHNGRSGQHDGKRAN